MKRFREMNDPRIEEKVKALVAQQTGVRIEELSLQTELGKELGIDGDDAVEFFEKFSEEFQVDLSTFQFDKYFGPEASFDPVLWLVSILSGTPIRKLEPVSIQDLVSAAKAKRWLKC